MRRENFFIFSTWDLIVHARGPLDELEGSWGRRQGHKSLEVEAGARQATRRAAHENDAAQGPQYSKDSASIAAIEGEQR